MYAKTTLREKKNTLHDTENIAENLLSRYRRSAKDEGDADPAGFTTPSDDTYGGRFYRLNIVFFFCPPPTTPNSLSILFIMESQSLNLARLIFGKKPVNERDWRSKAKLNCVLM